MAYTNIHGQEPSPPLPPESGPVEPRLVTFKDPHTGKDRTVKFPQQHPIIARAWREPIDVTQCQAPSARAGPPPSRIPARCPNKPATVVLVENATRGDGIIGGMALCDACCKRVLATHGPDYAKINPIA